MSTDVSFLIRPIMGSLIHKANGGGSLLPNVSTILIMSFSTSTSTFFSVSFFPRFAPMITDVWFLIHASPTMTVERAKFVGGQ